MPGKIPVTPSMSRHEGYLHAVSIRPHHRPGHTAIAHGRQVGRQAVDRLRREGQPVALHGYEVYLPACRNPSFNIAGVSTCLTTTCARKRVRHAGTMNLATSPVSYSASMESPQISPADWGISCPCAEAQSLQVEVDQESKSMDVEGRRSGAPHYA